MNKYIINISHGFVLHLFSVLRYAYTSRVDEKRLNKTMLDVTLKKGPYVPRVRQRRTCVGRGGGALCVNRIV